MCETLWGLQVTPSPEKLSGVTLLLWKSCY